MKNWSILTLLVVLSSATDDSTKAEELVEGPLQVLIGEHCPYGRICPPRPRSTTLYSTRTITNTSTSTTSTTLCMTAWETITVTIPSCTTTSITVSPTLTAYCNNGGRVPRWLPTILWPQPQDDTNEPEDEDEDEENDEEDGDDETLVERNTVSPNCRVNYGNDSDKYGETETGLEGGYETSPSFSVETEDDESIRRQCPMSREKRICKCDITRY